MVIEYTKNKKSDVDLDRVIEHTTHKEVMLG